MKRYLLGVFMAAFLGCSPNAGPGPDKNPGPGPGPDPEMMPQEAPFAEATTDGRIRIDKSALGRTLALTRTYAIGTNIDQLNPLRTQLVYFKLEDGGTVALKEIRNGTASPGAEDRTLSTFPVEDSDKAIVFDFNAGMKQLYVEFGIYQWWKQPKEFVVGINESAVRDLHFVADTLVIDCDETVDFPGAGPVPLSLTYGLRPYAQNQGFKPRTNNAVDGFYVNVPIPTPGGGEPVSYAHKHDVGEPIVYHVVSEMPPARRADVEVAVGYWNAIFTSIGIHDPIKLEPLPAGVKPLDPVGNVIDWRPSPADGAGRGINTTDPLTGQIIRSAVLVTSVFDIQGTDVATTRWAMAQLDAGMSPKPLPDAALARTLSDYYINTFTHEIGHGLGLRHNFAGNLTSTIDAKTYQKVFDSYLASDLPAGAVSTSSVMEYVETQLAVMVGAHIRLGRGPLPYDVQAITSLYGATEPTFGLYCEAELSPYFVDCAEFDQGNNPLVGTYWQWESIVDETAFKVAKTAASGAALEMADIDAQILLDPLSRLAKHLSKDAEYLAVLSKYPGDLTEAQHAQYRSDVLAYQKQGFQSLDGPRVKFVQDLVKSGLDAAQMNNLAAQVRARVKAYLTASGATVDPAVLDAYFTALAKALGEQVAPLNKISYACFTC